MAIKTSIRPHQPISEETSLSKQIISNYFCDFWIRSHDIFPQRRQLLVQHKFFQPLITNPSN